MSTAMRASAAPPRSSRPSVPSRSVARHTPPVAGTGALAPTRAPAPRRAEPGKRNLRLVPPVRRRVKTAPFVVLFVTLLAAGLVGLLMLNTVLAQDAFVLKDLRRTSAALTDQQQALMQEVAAAASPARLAERARELGMVENRNPVFIRLADAKVLGVPAPALPPDPGEGASR